ncbi:hypothetical protein D9758_012260 [Tetrapyrgos nigripes]|uniref:Pheromone-regulated membrane protein 10 n=1 Tax=Tetrapyrgos nigripes TaxID=182062 RepID=A0A8H5CHH5_9AGAR|nr:hypothetical protein D9758_012260 [Tetrapyrgos nigripes]
MPSNGSSPATTNPPTSIMAKSAKTSRKAVQWLDDHMNSQAQNSSSPPHERYLDEQGIDPLAFNELTSALERHQSQSQSQSQLQNTPMTRIHYFPPRPETRGGKPVSLSIQTNVSNPNAKSTTNPGPISLDKQLSTSTGNTTSSPDQNTTGESSPTSATRLRHGGSGIVSEPLLRRLSSSRRRHRSPDDGDHEQQYGPASALTNGTHTVPGETFIDPEESAGLPGVDLEGMAKRRATMIVRAHTRGRVGGIGGMAGLSSGNTTEDEGDTTDDSLLRRIRDKDEVGEARSKGRGRGRGREGDKEGGGITSFLSSFRLRRASKNDTSTNSQSGLPSHVVHYTGTPNEIKSRDYGFTSASTGHGEREPSSALTDVDLESLSGYGHPASPGSISSRIPSGGGVLSALLTLYSGQGQGQGYRRGQSSTSSNDYPSGYEGTLGPGSIASSGISTPGTEFSHEGEGYFDSDHHHYLHSQGRERERERERDAYRRESEETAYNTAANAYSGYGDRATFGHALELSDSQTTAVNTDVDVSAGPVPRSRLASPSASAPASRAISPTRQGRTTQSQLQSVPSKGQGRGTRSQSRGRGREAPPIAISALIASTGNIEGAASPGAASIGSNLSLVRKGKRVLAGLKAGKRDWHLSRYRYSGDGPPSLPAQEDAEVEREGYFSHDKSLGHKASKSLGDLHELGEPSEIELERLGPGVAHPEMMRHSSSQGTTASGTHTGTGTSSSSGIAGMGTPAIKLATPASVSASNSRDTDTSSGSGPGSSSSGTRNGTGSGPGGYATPADAETETDTVLEPGGHLNRNIGGMRLDLSGHQPKTVPGDGHVDGGLGQGQKMSNPVSQYISPLSSAPASSGKSRVGIGFGLSASAPGTPSLGIGGGHKKERSNRWSGMFTPSLSSLQLPLPLLSPGGMLRSGRSTPMSGETSVSLEEKGGEKGREKGGEKAGWVWHSKEREREREREKERERERKERKKRKKAEIYITRHVAKIIQRQEFLMKLVRAMMMFGAPAHRLQAQIKATAHVLDVDISCMYLPDVFLISFDDASTGTSLIKFIRQGSALDLGKLRDAYSVYWKVIHDDISVSSASKALDNLMRSPPHYRTWQLMLFGGLCSSSICSVSFNGSFLDSIVVFPLGCFLVFLQILSVRNELYSNVFEITITTLFSFICGALAQTHRICYSAVTSASIVLILPGFIVLSGALEVLSRNIVSGSVRMCYAVVYCLFLGFGLAMGAQAYQQIVGHDIVGLTDTSCSMSHRSDLGWWQQPPSKWWAFLTVPMFSLFLSLRNQAPIWRKETALLVGIACIGWVVNHFTSLRFTSQSDIAAAFGAFAVGFVANMYSRFLRGNAFVIMITGILFQVPSGLGQNGLLVFVSEQSTGSGSSYISGFQTSLQLISVAIGLTVGLGIALFLAHPIPSRKRAAGVFSL